jgi:hypothetical protein
MPKQAGENNGQSARANVHLGEDLRNDVDELVSGISDSRSRQLRIGARVWVRVRSIVAESGVELSDEELEEVIIEVVGQEFAARRGEEVPADD